MATHVEVVSDSKSINIVTQEKKTYLSTEHMMWEIQPLSSIRFAVNIYNTTIECVYTML